MERPHHPLAFAEALILVRAASPALVARNQAPLLVIKHVGSGFQAQEGRGLGPVSELARPRSPGFYAPALPLALLNRLPFPPSHGWIDDGSRSGSVSESPGVWLGGRTKTERLSKNAYVRQSRQIAFSHFCSIQLLRPLRLRILAGPRVLSPVLGGDQV
ncbi:hypothetical protein MAPG_01504 [Magnaporthiopsis poae ATCC 64411]|uniref:Uncharacterized protein n=1 Tax=Magnaporthiopsis poae (strain ATCC 64411 / 73-15) TaxID=644358 RepID=A0A0C4DNV7_MAGP6|nr:hypothetical protein MAPG_01504 [Magnaporthiopsis poae ATCC 64411]